MIKQDGGQSKDLILPEQTRSWLEIDLDRLASNTRFIRRSMAKQCVLSAVVKADAYGHGATQVAPVLLANGVQQLAVAFLEEGVELRQAGIDAPILILGYTDPTRVDALLEYRLTPTVYSCDFAEALSRAACERGVRARIHIKIDTGMSRIGFPADAESVERILWIRSRPNLLIEGLFTHFASAEEADEQLTIRPFKSFIDFCDTLKQAGLQVPVKHVCNSAASMRFPNMHLDMIRPGLIFYGLLPKGCPNAWSGLQPIMRLQSRVIRVRTFPEGTTVGYGHDTVLTRERTIATIGIGYADGYLRRLYRHGEVLIRGQRAPLIGRICMDICMIDVTDIAGSPIKQGEGVVLFGSLEGDCPPGLSIDTVAEWQDTINYEVTCLMGRRLPRVYVKNGQSVQVRNDLLRQF